MDRFPIHTVWRERGPTGYPARFPLLISLPYGITLSAKLPARLSIEDPSSSSSQSWDDQVQHFFFRDLPRLNTSASSRPAYDPPDFTSQEVLADNDADPAEPPKLQEWNLHTKGTAQWSEDPRRSCYNVRVDAVTGRPLNPFGRTGLCGRGALKTWGPSQSHGSQTEPNMS